MREAMAAPMTPIPTNPTRVWAVFMGLGYGVSMGREESREEQTGEEGGVDRLECEVAFLAGSRGLVVKKIGGILVWGH